MYLLNDCDDSNQAFSHVITTDLTVPFMASRSLVFAGAETTACSCLRIAQCGFIYIS